MTSQENYAIGIDTGGTYTDAVLVAQRARSVLASAKALTTKGDLALGIMEALDAVIAHMPATVSKDSISLVSVSTTLATNAVVEGHGSAVGILLIGFDQQMLARTGIAQGFPTAHISLIAGGHDHNGAEVQPLDGKALQQAVAAMQGQVSAFAIASTFAVRNPRHEHVARDMVIAQTHKPVTISSEITSALDAPRRALTAVLNARLISRIAMLVSAVQQAMLRHALNCPLMVVKGDGSLARAEMVALRPIETILSGPAASLVGARWLSGLADFIMSDIGGTTTDIGIVKNGRPQVAVQGAEVGGWRTMVQAIDVKTIGLGGDSAVHVQGDGQISLGPERVVPISLLGSRFPNMHDLLAADLSDSSGGSQQGQFVLLPFGRSQHGEADALSEREKALMGQLGDQPMPLRKVAMSSAAQRTLAALRKRGLVQVSGFTPSDAAHILGLQENWSATAAAQAARLLLRFHDMRMPDEARLKSFCHAVWSKTVAGSAQAILSAATGLQLNENILAQAVCDGLPQVRLVQVGLSPQVPIVAVGGPAQVYYGEVGKRLACATVFAPHCNVANAIGAAVAVIVVRVTVEVTGEGDGQFRVLGDEQAVVFQSAAQALAFAVARAEAQVQASAQMQCAGHIEVHTAVDKYYLPNAVNDDGLLKALITSEAIADPV